MNAASARSFPVVSPRARDVVEHDSFRLSSRKKSGQKSGQKFPHAEHAEILHRGVAFDPHRARALFPDQWTAFLHAHHQSIEEVAMFYGVTDKAARKWWNGLGGPNGFAVLHASRTNPEGFQQFLVAAE